MISKAIPCIYEMSNIGVDGTLEAINVNWYCSHKCALHGLAVFDMNKTPIKLGENQDYIEGTVCDYCGKGVIK